MTAIHAERVRCQYCSKEKAKGAVIHLPGNMRICLDCYAWHRRSMDRFTQSNQRSCADCDAPFFVPPRNLRGYLCVKDGGYQLLCERCRDRYRPKRRDLYGETAVGQALKL